MSDAHWNGLLLWGTFLLMLMPSTAGIVGALERIAKALEAHNRREELKQ